ncbi:uncharacterized protein ASPGLDRAFT_475208 [Aspergillus glaucus CBS 516.65]|uniref:F-box domain-containing protein n=1 Tax=Aspergillus glaucus CBS 516.65 TaxID=1160497 RepID=A0A1L9VH83_ASPGL|nr:hypothetical protein ASPGLDRAFT_475208 [Aspergillus glaucus CBS 516.65]OJJ83250.1 hypothetical protein ASPGLDRAFT_475208 [Aspergillus glaucus CBS 516.65]
MPHAIFSIPEIFESILLSIDLHTLLLSQRVCKKFHALISTSSALQEALFFKPVRHQLPYGSEDRVRNSLVEDYLWQSQFLQSHNDALTRPEASWRRMVFQQPPTSTICVIEYSQFWGKPRYRRFKFTKADGGCLRMEDVVTAVPGMDANTDCISILVPGEDKWILWHEPSLDLDKVKKLEEKYENERAATTTMFLEDCDFVVFVRVCGYLRPGAWHDVGERQLTGWLESIGKGEYVEDVENYDE